MNRWILKIMVGVLVGVALLSLTGGIIAQAASQQKQIVLKVVESGSLDAGEKAVIANFEVVYPNIKVEVQEIPWGNVFQQMVLRVQEGDPPDVWTGAPAIYIPVFAEMEGIIPLDNFISPALRAEYFDSIWPMVTYQGKIYGIPSAFSTKALYWNKDLFAKAGIKTPPTTWNELYADAKAITERTDAWGIGLDGMGVLSTSDQFLNYLYQNGGRVINKEGNVTINDKKGVDTLAFLVSLKGFAPNPIENAREKTLATLFREGKIAMYIGGPWRRHGFLTKEGLNFGVAPLPAGHYGPSSCVLVADAALIMKGAKHEDAALKFALFYTDFQNQLIRDTSIGLGKAVNPTDPTALTPMRKIEAQLPFFQQEPTWEPFIDIIPRGVPQPMLKSYPDFQDALNKAIQKAFLGQATPKEALDEVAARISG